MTTSKTHRLLVCLIYLPLPVGGFRGKDPRISLVKKGIFVGETFVNSEKLKISKCQKRKTNETTGNFIRRWLSPLFLR